MSKDSTHRMPSVITYQTSAHVAVVRPSAVQEEGPVEVILSHWCAARACLCTICWLIEMQHRWNCVWVLWKSKLNVVACIVSYWCWEVCYNAEWIEIHLAHSEIAGLPSAVQLNIAAFYSRCPNFLYNANVPLIGQFVPGVPPNAVADQVCVSVAVRENSEEKTIQDCI